MQAVQEMRKDLYKYITDNPSYEEAERNVIKQVKMEFQVMLRK